MSVSRTNPDDENKCSTAGRENERRATCSAILYFAGVPSGTRVAADGAKRIFQYCFSTATKRPYDVTTAVRQTTYARCAARNGVDLIPTQENTLNENVGTSTVVKIEHGDCTPLKNSQRRATPLRARDEIEWGQGEIKSVM